MQQQLVPALSDSNASLTVSEDGIVMKPHGHGDVHTLLYNSGKTISKLFDDYSRTKCLKDIRHS